MSDGTQPFLDLFPANRKLQCKGIPDLPVLKFLAGDLGKYADGYPTTWGTWFDYGPEPPSNSVVRAMPKGAPPRLVLAKMKRLCARGFIDGCPCGCRGDFVLTDKGRAFIAAHENQTDL